MPSSPSDSPPEPGRFYARLTPLAARIRDLIGRREIVVMLVLAVLAGGTWGFLELAEAVGEGETARVDERILLLFREGNDPDDPIGPQALESVVRDVTSLGSPTVALFLTLAVIVYFLLDRRPRMGLFVLLAVGGGAGFSYALKFLYNRTRPSLLPPEALPADPSFPSGHAALAAAVYLTLGLLLARAVPRRGLRVYVVGLAVVLTLAVGLSRLYLGVHWPSDVLAGWTLGGLWALLCWQAERRLQRRGLVERSASVRRPRRAVEDKPETGTASEPV